MISLHSLQQRFADVVTGADPAALDALVVARGIPAHERAGIYRNNVRATFRSTMSIGFPATERLVGAECFRALADAYQRAHPSRSGNLQHVGADFGRFVAERFAATPYTYIADVVALEWAYQEVVAAAEHAPLDLAHLAAVSPDDYGRLCMALHPAARLVDSQFPIGRIWRANRSDTLDETPIELDAGSDRVLLMRRGLDVEIHRLEVADFGFLRALAGGETLERSLDNAMRSSPTVDPAMLLARYVQLGVIVDCWIQSADASAGTASAPALRLNAQASAP